MSFLSPVDVASGSVRWTPRDPTWTPHRERLYYGSVFSYTECGLGSRRRWQSRDWSGRERRASTGKSRDRGRTRVGAEDGQYRNPESREEDLGPVRLGGDGEEGGVLGDRTRKEVDRGPTRLGGGRPRGRVGEETDLTPTSMVSALVKRKFLLYRSSSATEPRDREPRGRADRPSQIAGPLSPEGPGTPPPPKARTDPKEKGGLLTHVSTETPPCEFHETPRVRSYVRPRLHVRRNSSGP